MQPEKHAFDFHIETETFEKIVKEITCIAKLILFGI